MAYVVSVSAPTTRSGWLLGGDIPEPNDLNRVAGWSAGSVRGPWLPSAFTVIPGRDGPNETILGFAPPATNGPEVAFGSRRAPREGYPRPSTWVLTGNGWREILADRELFGGPDVVGVGDGSDGGLTSGPHGYHLAGTWTGPTNAVVPAVWSSADGQVWTRNDSDPSFDAGRNSQSYGYDIADGSSGLLMVGTTAEPTPADPTLETGAMWWSRDGARWKRLPAIGSAGRVNIYAVRPIASGWIAGGTASQSPIVWYVDSSLRLAAFRLPGSGAVTDIAVSQGQVWAAGVSSSGAPELWAASVRAGIPRPWREVKSPYAGTGWTQARIAVQANEVLLVVFNANASEVWAS